MKLKLLKFREAHGSSEWQFDDLSLRDRNLIVGVNASGKSRLLRSINILASLLSKRLQPAAVGGSLRWNAQFIDDQLENYEYELEVNNSAIVNEKFSKSGSVLLDRSAGKIGTILMERAGKPSEAIEFKIPENELAAPTKMDLMQTPFLEPLIKWGESAFYYQFGTSLGQGALGFRAQNPVSVEQFEHDENSALPKFAFANQHYAGEFQAVLKSDMGRMGYAIEEASLLPSTSVTSPFMQVVSLSVKEADLDSPTEQLAMSQGMFRTYSILIHANYLVLSNRCGCLLIDDIGEGLDFERSCSLIDLLTEKAKKGCFQLVMTTNDRFIMNHVPLQDWTVIRRTKGRADVFNYSNSRKHFDEFKFTGLNNFDFFAMDFLEESVDGPREEGAVHEENGNLR